MQGKTLIQNYTKRWQLLRGLEGVLYGCGIGLCIGFVFKSFLIGCIVFIGVTGLALLFIKPWQINLKKATRFIDAKLHTAEYSAGLVLQPQQKLSGLAQLQQQKISAKLAKDLKEISPETGLKPAAIVSLLCFLVGYFFYLWGGSNLKTPLVPESERMMSFQPSDSIAPAYEAPTLVDQKITIRYPEYTQVPSRTSSRMNVKVVEGSQLFWNLNFDGMVKEALWEGLDDELPMKITTNTQSNTKQSKAFIQVVPNSSGYYNFRYLDSLGASYVSDIYAIEVIEDRAPEIRVKELAQFSSFEHDDRKELNFSAQITDDFGLESAQIIATVTKGSGESVKFREEKLAFDQAVKKGSKEVQLSKTINLDQLKMELGDELYFYVETSDQKTPRPNIARSETFFAVIKDTVSDGFGVEGTMGADLMPDYFRSQRQLIIDTEKLIKDHSQITEKEFKSRSNELGFDQKALRLKYGQFMGDEADSGIAVQPEIDLDDFDPEDPTAGFRHDHDSENEHNLVEEEDHDHEEEHDHGEEEGEESLLEAYLHNHDDPEESTLFTESLRGKLKQAMAQMWDAELYLRLATPKESLPYQYEALKLIQEIKNSARIYVHRIGFDPPPIKEDKRLSGDLDEIENYYKQDNLGQEDSYEAMRRSIAILEMRIQTKEKLTDGDKEAFAKAGKELTILAINEPSKHLKTLQYLKWLTEDKQQPIEILMIVKTGLLRALPEDKSDPFITPNYRSQLEKIFLQELETSDR